MEENPFILFVAQLGEFVNPCSASSNGPAWSRGGRFADERAAGSDKSATLLGETKMRGAALQARGANRGNHNDGWRVRVAKPAGGFVFIKADNLLRAWLAVKDGEIDLYAFRVWLACHELVARRCCMDRRLKACYRVEELQPLVGCGYSPRLRRAVRALEQAGLMEWRGDDLCLSPEPLADGEEAEDLLEMRQAVQNWRRKVPVPRRVLRFLAGQRRKVLIATMLGHLIRCVYYRGNACLSGGRCKASWIADVFGVDVRNVKAARKELIESGWLTVVPSSQHHLNRWGLAVVVDLHHDFSTGNAKPRTQSPPPGEQSTAQSPPPGRNRNLSSRSENQNPAQRRPTGAYARNGPQRKSPPALRDVRPIDLEQPNRLDGLYRQAVEAGMIRHSQANRLNWFAAAERAKQVSTQNPPGCFLTIIRDGLWHHINSGQEDAARTQLHKLDFG